VTGDVPTTLVWIAPDPPDAEETRALASWARTHGIELRPPRDERSLVATSVPGDLGVVDEVEDLVERAHDATAAREGDAIDRATAAAEDRLRAHPELPQAAWLMAEVERARSTRWRRIDPTDAEAADREWVRAEALDGGRMPGLGETSAASQPADAQVTLALPDGDEARLDGAHVSEAGVTATHAGPHALVVMADGAPVWAGWIDLPPGPSAVEIDAPAPTPCSSADAARASLTAGDSAGVSASVRAQRVRCARWVAVAPGPTPGALRIATCEGARCSDLLVWRDVPPWIAPAPVAGNPEAGRLQHPWPRWATWVLAGAGVAVAAGIAVAASGALQAAPTETRFVSGGLKNP
jgi:hypothetical protein